MKLSAFHSDPTKSEQGVWVEVANGFKLRVARMDNIRYKLAMKSLGKPFAAQLRHAATEDDEKTVKKIMIQAMAKTVLLGWEGLEDDEGKTIPYSVEECEKALSVENFFNLVRELAADQSNFAEKSKDELSKNS